MGKLRSHYDVAKPEDPALAKYKSTLSANELNELDHSYASAVAKMRKALAKPKQKKCDTKK